MEALLVIVGKQVFDILQFTIGKKVNMRTLEILEYNETDPIGTPRKSFKESRR